MRTRIKERKKLNPIIPPSIRDHIAETAMIIEKIHKLDPTEYYIRLKESAAEFGFMMCHDDPFEIALWYTGKDKEKHVMEWYDELYDVYEEQSETPEWQECKKKYLKRRID